MYIRIKKRFDIKTRVVLEIISFCLSILCAFFQSVFSRFMKKGNQFPDLSGLKDLEIFKIEISRIFKRIKEQRGTMTDYNLNQLPMFAIHPLLRSTVPNQMQNSSQYENGINFNPNLSSYSTRDINPIHNSSHMNESVVNNEYRRLQMKYLRDLGRKEFKILGSGTDHINDYNNFNEIRLRDDQFSNTNTGIRDLGTDIANINNMDEIHNMHADTGNVSDGIPNLGEDISGIRNIPGIQGISRISGLSGLSGIQNNTANMSDIGNIANMRGEESIEEDSLDIGNENIIQNSDW